MNMLQLTSVPLYVSPFFNSMRMCAFSAAFRSVRGSIYFLLLPAIFSAPHEARSSSRHSRDVPLSQPLLPNCRVEPTLPIRQRRRMIDVCMCQPKASDADDGKPRGSSQFRKSSGKINAEEQALVGVRGGGLEGGQEGIKFLDLSGRWMSLSPRDTSVSTPACSRAPSSPSGAWVSSIDAYQSAAESVQHCA